MSAEIFCIHGVQGECVLCRSDKHRLSSEPLSEERKSIAEYLERAARTDIGSVLSEGERQGVAYAAAWVRNRLDLAEKEEMKNGEDQ